MYDQFGNPVQFVHGQQSQQYQPGFTGGAAAYPQFDAMSGPGQPRLYEQPRLEMQAASIAPSPYLYSPERYPFRKPRIPRHSDSPLSRRKKKSTTRKLVEGGLAAGIGIAASSYLERNHHTTAFSGDQHGIGSGGSIINKVLEGAVLTAEAVGLAGLEKSKHRDRSHSLSSEETDPRLTKLVEGALATAGAVALAYHEKNKRPTRVHMKSRHRRE